MGGAWVGVVLRSMTKELRALHVETVGCRGALCQNWLMLWNPEDMAQCYRRAIQDDHEQIQRPK